MLEFAAWFCLIAMLAMLMGQGSYVALYLQQLAREKPVGADAKTFQPVVAVLLCVRGQDPSLEACIRALDQLDWPDYEIFCGFDSEQDSAFELVSGIRGTLKHPLHRYVLDHQPDSCSPKCAVLAELVESLDERFEVVAFVDADCIVGPDWLRLLVHPLAEPEVGVVSGTRWFSPPPGQSHRLGTTVRAIWNAAAIVQMHLYRIVWGGSMALRRREIDELRLADIWQSQLCEDTCLTGLMAAEGLRVVRPAALVVANHETTPLETVPAWISRQLLTIRLYNRWWPLVASHGLSVGLLTPLVIVTVVAALVGGSLTLALILLAGLVAYLAGSLCLLIPIASAHDRQLMPIDGSRPRSSMDRDWWWWLAGIPVTQLVHLLATLKTLWAKRLVWRQVRYRLEGGAVEVEHFAPYQASQAEAEGSVH